ncbi:MAG: histidine kinase [Nitrospirae bacterium]|nr:histidine kinase [Nitrospirota bacterium]
MPAKDLQRLVHKLQIRQVALERQNEAFRQAQIHYETIHTHDDAFYDNAPAGYLILDHKGVILDANLPACGLLGTERNLLVGQSVIQFVAAQDQITYVRHLRLLSKTGLKQVCEVGLVPQQGVRRSMKFLSVVVPGEVGRQIHVHTVVLDITERLCAAALQARQHEREQQQHLAAQAQMGHDLHDGSLQSIFAIGLGLEAGKQHFVEASEKAAALLVRSVDELNSVMQEVRGLIGGLAGGSAVPAHDLAGSLRTMADTLAQFHGQPVHVSIDAAVAGGLPSAQRVELLKLAKEVLSNSLRHAQASCIQLSLFQRKDHVYFVVRDNGIGYNRNEVTGSGHGLVSMEARADSMGATLSVSSIPQQGTCVVLDLSNRNGKHDTVRGGLSVPCGSINRRPRGPGVRQAPWMRGARRTLRPSANLPGTLRSVPSWMIMPMSERGREGGDT